MTVESVTSSVDYTGNGVTTAFPTTFQFFNDTDLVVSKITADGVVTVLTLNTDYTVAGASSNLPGSIVTSVPIPSGYTLHIERVLPVRQLTSLRNQGPFFANIHENVFDYLTMLIQQAITGVSRSLQKPPGKNYYDAKGAPISNLADPTFAQDAATKNWTGRYIDSVSGLINTVTGIAYDGGTLFDYFRFGVGRTVDTIASLRGLSATRNQRAFVLGYYAKGDGGGGHYWADASDTTSTDNGGDIIVAADGTRWRLVITRTLDVRQFGAKADDGAGAGSDSFAAIQATISRAVALKIGMVSAPGKYKILDTLVMDTGVFTQSIVLFGDGPTSQIRQAGAGKDAIVFSRTQVLRNSGLRDISVYCEATAGHGVNIEYSCTVCFFTNVNVTVLNPVKSLYLGNWSAYGVGARGCFDSVWEGGDYYLSVAHTAFGFDFITNGTTFNENSFRNLRCSQSGTVQMFRAVNTHNSSYLTNNRFENINFEICKGGGILAYNAKGWTLDNITFWDTPLYTGNLIHFATNSGLVGVANTFNNIQRNGDVLNAGVKDIFLEYSEDNVVTNCYTVGGVYDWGNRRTYITGIKLPTEANTANRIYTNLTSSITGSASITGTTGAVLYVENLTVSRTSTGLYRFTFPFARLVTTYRVHAQLSTGAAGWVLSNKQLAYFELSCINSAGTAFDPGTVDVTVIG